jgi:hypothetical protein
LTVENTLKPHDKAFLDFGNSYKERRTVMASDGVNEEYEF